MKRLSGVVIMLFVLSAAHSQNVQVVSFNQLQKRIDNTNDTIYLVNFWTTWCHSCVEEIPHFVKFTAQYKEYNGKPVKLLFVSLDFKETLENKVIPFIKDKGMKDEVVLLDDMDYNSWLPKVDPAWQGTIPVTLFIYKPLNVRKFIGDEMEYSQLEALLKSNIN